MQEKMRTKRETLIERIIDRDVSDGKGARETKRANLRTKSLEELERIWNQTTGH